MKVGILTFHWAYNYGAILQAYGLSQVLAKLGHSVKIIDYAPPGCRAHCWQAWGFRAGNNLLSRARRRLRFDSFRDTKLSLTKRCRTAQDLRAIAAELHAVIVGSDQVWNANITKSAYSSYFLDFVDPPCRRIAYAACFGEPRQPNCIRTHAGTLLCAFHSISVRNEMSARLVRQLSGRTPDIVLDPSLIFDYTGFVPGLEQQDGYIAGYVHSPRSEVLGHQVMAAVGQRLRLPVVLIPADADRPGSTSEALAAGPAEWLRILAASAFICTDSFHGLAVALALKKPFIVWSGIRPQRLQSLLQLVGLDTRFVERFEQNGIDRLVDTHIPHEAVAHELALRAKQSSEFLMRALQY